MVVAVLSQERQQRDARLCRVQPGKLRTGSVNRGSHRNGGKKTGPTQPAIPAQELTVARHAHREGKLTENVREDTRSAGEPKGTRAGVGQRKTRVRHRQRGQRGRTARSRTGDRSAGVEPRDSGYPCGLVRGHSGYGPQLVREGTGVCI